MRKSNRCCLVGVHAALLEKVCLKGWPLGFQKPKPGPVSFFLLPTDSNAEVSNKSPALCLPVFCYVSHNDEK